MVRSPYLIGLSLRALAERGIHHGIRWSDPAPIAETQGYSMLLYPPLVDADGGVRAGGEASGALPGSGRVGAGSAGPGTGGGVGRAGLRAGAAGGDGRVVCGTIW